jgi:hypothetical protein
MSPDGRAPSTMTPSLSLAPNWSLRPRYVTVYLSSRLAQGLVGPRPNRSEPKAPKQGVALLMMPPNLRSDNPKHSSDATLSIEEAFDAALAFMEEWWQRDHEVQLGQVLAIAESHGLDYAGGVMQQWQRCVREVIERRNKGRREYGVVLQRGDEKVVVRSMPSDNPRADEDLLYEQVSSVEAFEVTLLYMRTWDRPEALMAGVLGESQLTGPGATMDPAAWDGWVRCVRSVLALRS